MFANILHKIVAIILGLMIFGVAVQAPIAVFAETVFPDIAPLIKAWKEILLLPVVVLLVYVLQRRNEWGWFFGDRFVRLGCAFVALHALVALTVPTTMLQVFSGLLIDTRFVVYFLCVYTLLHLQKNLARYIVIPAVAIFSGVIVFGVLQVIVLPKDFLSLFGYGPQTIQPYLTVDNNEAYIRINSTLRGPNPLGLYVVVMTAFVGALLYTYHKKRAVYRPILSAVVSVLCVLLVLFHTYSRSAYIVAFVTALVLAYIAARGVKKWRRVFIPATIAAALVSVGIVAATWQSPFVQQVVFHTDIYEENAVNSDQQHHASVQAAVAAIADKPLGAGIGSTGSASLFSDKPFIIENYYLFVAHEVGWGGVILFMALWGYILYALLKTATPISRALGASGIGILIAAMVLPVWADDTVALTWWGLAALALAPSRRGVT